MVIFSFFFCQFSHVFLLLLFIFFTSLLSSSPFPSSFIPALVQLRVHVLFSLLGARGTGVSSSHLSIRSLLPLFLLQVSSSSLSCGRTHACPSLLIPQPLPPPTLSLICYHFIFRPVYTLFHPTSSSYLHPTPCLDSLLSLFFPHALLYSVSCLIFVNSLFQCCHHDIPSLYHHRLSIYSSSCLFQALYHQLLYILPITTCTLSSNFHFRILLFNLTFIFRALSQKKIMLFTHFSNATCHAFDHNLRCYITFLSFSHTFSTCVFVCSLFLIFPSCLGFII